MIARTGRKVIRNPRDRTMNLRDRTAGGSDRNPVGPSGFEPESSGPEPPRIDQATPRTQDGPRSGGSGISVVRHPVRSRVFFAVGPQVGFTARSTMLIFGSIRAVSSHADSVFDTLI